MTNSKKYFPRAVETDELKEPKKMIRESYRIQSLYDGKISKRPSLYEAIKKMRNDLNGYAIIFKVTTYNNEQVEQEQIIPVPLNNYQLGKQ